MLKSDAYPFLSETKVLKLRVNVIASVVLKTIYYWWMLLGLYLLTSVFLTKLWTKELK